MESFENSFQDFSSEILNDVPLKSLWRTHHGEFSKVLVLGTLLGYVDTVKNSGRCFSLPLSTEESFQAISFEDRERQRIYSERSEFKMITYTFICQIYLQS